jgi:hypothetical protein
VSLDAGHANHATARTLVSAGGEYLIQLKGNAPTVHAAAAHAVLGAAPLFSTDDCHHGRTEHRDLRLAAATPEQLGFPHAATVLAVTSAVTNKKTGAESGETRHFVSSLERGALTPRQWLARVRGDWRGESANHYRRDVTCREEAELARNPRRACNLALLRSALSPNYASRPSAALRFLCSSRLPHEVIPESRGLYRPGRSYTVTPCRRVSPLRSSTRRPVSMSAVSALREPR